MSSTVLAVFVPTFVAVSVTPGMCMTLSMTLGMTIGVRRTLWMMAGELIGVGLVAGASVVGVAAIMLQYPMLFLALKYLGGLYLCYLGVQMWMAKGKMAIDFESGFSGKMSAPQLALQGFVTAVANPKGWAFFIALLPPFIDQQRPLPGQLSLLLGIILCIEFISLVLYASGGRTLNHLLQKSDNVRLLNRIAGTLMFAVGVWLAVD
ncbi:Threonine/homoserine/homoserine lactone efflux protein [Malonomonas rubra DSM 5091]|uniref:Threonine/homoserine/homoserine lactone efflux protein n=1 Tax=Malonomonas rubra DSM 5091 TaxID=1122189 RepID=A0A1M6I4V5_MALRU|nr:LysE family translocator [Malonomonas rubra]SHJ29458.1 Threonine/homoserine/homoserine lactone efflux protein [Malonomonas rubra DSM 5091]